MGYLAAAIVAIFLISLFVASPGFRIFVGVVGLLLAGGGVYVYQEDQADKAKYEAAERAAYSRIPSANLIIQYPVSQVRGGVVYFNARLLNEDPNHIISQVVLHISYSDCTAPGSCIVVGEDVVTIRQQIPPGQAREVNEPLLKWPTSIRGNLEWSYQIRSIKS